MVAAAGHWNERPPVGLRVLPKRLHYGWWIVVGTAVLMFVTIGVGYYGLAVFLRPLQEEHGWSNATVRQPIGQPRSRSG